MRRSSMSFITAGIALLGAVALLGFERSFAGLLWLLIRLFRRVMRLLLFS